MLRFILLVSLLTLAACGQKGPLYFAEPAQPPATTSTDDTD